MNKDPQSTETKMADSSPATLLDRFAQCVESKLTSVADSNVAWHIRMLIRVASHEKRQLDMCGELLTKAGVPEWVEIGGEPVPANSTPQRLEWYLARRKDVAPCEIDHDLQRDLSV